MNNIVSEKMPVPFWEFITILAAIIVGTILIVFLICKVVKIHKIKKSEIAVNTKIEETANKLATSFGGNRNIKEITTRGSRVSVTVKDPSLVDKATIDSTLDSVMYMGNKVVFIIGEKSPEFERLLKENTSKTNRQ